MIIDCMPYFLRHRKLKEVEDMVGNPGITQYFPPLFVLNKTSNKSISLRVGVKERKLGMVEKLLVIDIHKGLIRVYSHPQNKLETHFSINQLVACETSDEDLTLRVIFRNQDNFIRIFGRKEPYWTRTMHTKSVEQRDYIGSIFQGLVGLKKSLNKKNKFLSSTELIDVGNEKLRIFCGTWNMGNNVAPDFAPSKFGVSPAISTWLLLDEKEHDLFVIGVQEKAEGVYNAVEKYLGAKFILIARNIMGQIGIAIYIRKRMISFVRHVETVHEATGFAGVGTNKGFVAVAMTFLEQPLLFINCHLAARSDPGRLKQRKHQIKLCVRRLKLGRLIGTDVLHQFTTFWIGDMNFRVKAEDKDEWPGCGRTRNGIIKSLYEDGSKKGIHKILKGDQLTIEKEKGVIFSNFYEMKPYFPPTYKYKEFAHDILWRAIRDPKTDIVLGHVAKEVEPTEFSIKKCIEDLGRDQANTIKGYYLTARLKGQRREYTNHKLQVPSWCDRILYRPLPSVNVKQHLYRCIDDVVTSDHSPVASSFTVSIPKPFSQNVKSAFHVVTIQFLSLEVVRFRHPGKPLDTYFDEKVINDSKKEQIMLKNLGKKKIFDKYGKKIRTDSEDSEPEIYSSKKHLSVKASELDRQSGSNRKSTKRKSNKRKMTDDGINELTTKDGKILMHLPQLAVGCVFPPLRDASSKIRTTSNITKSLTDEHTWSLSWEEDYNKKAKMEKRKYGMFSSRRALANEQVEYSWSQNDLQSLNIGPLFTTREYLKSQWFVLHLFPKQNSSTSDSAAACVISLKDAALGGTYDFEGDLEHNGQPSGKIRGTLRVFLNGESGWKKKYARNPQSHPLHPSRLSRKIPDNTMAQQQKNVQIQLAKKEFQNNKLNKANNNNNNSGGDIKNKISSDFDTESVYSETTVDTNFDNLSVNVDDDYMDGGLSSANTTPTNSIRLIKKGSMMSEPRNKMSMSLTEMPITPAQSTTTTSNDIQTKINENDILDQDDDVDINIPFEDINLEKIKPTIRDSKEDIKEDIKEDLETNNDDERISIEINNNNDNNKVIDSIANDNDDDNDNNKVIDSIANDNDDDNDNNSTKDDDNNSKNDDDNDSKNDNDIKDIESTKDDDTKDDDLKPQPKISNSHSSISSKLSNVTERLKNLASDLQNIKDKSNSQDLSVKLSDS